MNYPNLVYLHVWITSVQRISIKGQIARVGFSTVGIIQCDTVQVGA